MNSSRGAEEQRSGGERDIGAKTTSFSRSRPPLLRSSAPLLLCLFALALLVRSLGLTWGLPDAARWYSYHPDESTRQVVGGVVSLLQGDWNPHFFNYPSLSIYATWLVYQFLLVLGLTTDAAAPQYPWPVVRDIIFAGRLFSALCGALTAPLVWVIARRLKAGNWAILAGILAALAPGHVQHSHFATVDVPATFFVTLCLYLTLRAENKKGLLWAALVAGLAAGTKYNVGLVLIAPLVALWLLPNGNLRSRILGSFAFILAAFLAFLVSTPYALLAPGEFWGEPSTQSGFAYELLVHPRQGSGEIFQNTGNGWIYHATFNLPFVLTWPLIIAACIGIYFAAKKREWWPMLAFLGLFFFSLGFSQVRFMRYLLPLVPILCLLAAYGAARLPKPRIWGAILGLFALWGAKDVLWPFLQTDPRDQAAPFLKGQQVAMLGNPWFYTPPFQPQGFNSPVAGVEVTGGKVGKSPLVISEFEWREPLRLGRTDLEAVNLVSNPSITARQFKNRVPLALPGRPFVPHDYLYTNPETRIY